MKPRGKSSQGRAGRAPGPSAGCPDRLCACGWPAEGSTYFQNVGLGCLEAHSAQPPTDWKTRLLVSHLCLLQPRLHPRLSCGFSFAFPCQHSSSLEAPECLQKPKPEKKQNKTWLFLPQSKKGLLCHSGEDINYYPLWVIILGSVCAVSARLDGKGIFSMKPVLFF